MLCAEEKNKFVSAFKAGFVPHACIIEGMSDKAKEEFVAFCVKYLLCRQDGACGTCSSCRKLASGNHPDLTFVGGDGKAANMDSVRRIIADSRMVPVENGKKVYVIRCGEKLRKEAQNALLKLLEEPPKAAVIFILTEKKEALLPTIRSRCRMISLSDEPEEKQDKASCDARDKAERLIGLLFKSERRFDFYIAVTEKTTRDKLALMLKEFEYGLTEVLKAKYGVINPAYAEYAAHIGHEKIAEMIETVSNARRAADGNANLSSLQMALAVRLWEIKI